MKSTPTPVDCLFYVNGMIVRDTFVRYAIDAVAAAVDSVGAYVDGDFEQILIRDAAIEAVIAFATQLDEMFDGGGLADSGHTPADQCREEIRAALLN